MAHPRRIHVLVLIVSLGFWLISGTARKVSAQSASVPGFTFFHEFYGNFAYTDPQVTQHLQGGMANGLTFTPLVDPGIVKLANTYNAELMLRLAGAPWPAGGFGNEIEDQRVAFETLAATNPQLEFAWDLMPEWDQSGGAWVPLGRPSYVNLSKPVAYSRFVNYYRSTYPTLINYLTAPPSGRNYLLAAVTDFSPNTFYTYEMGAELCMLERGIDDLGDLSTGLAFLRGAARQYGRPWGIDLSTWRSSNGMATQYSNQNILQGGWSASYLMRHYYASFAAGANVIQNEADTYLNPNGQLNPFAAATQDFASYALRRHPDAGNPAVSTAFLIDHDNGFDPKHGVYNQGNAVWYQDIPYSSGDFMFDNVLRLAYPNHWLHGLAPGAPFANSAGVPDEAHFRAFLSSGGDPRPDERIPSTRWGDNLDIITTQAGDSALTQYKAIVLLGDVHLDTRLRTALLAWVQQGGTLVINASQMTAADTGLAGVTMNNTPLRSAKFSRWLSNRTSQSEPPYSYAAISNVNAEILAVNEVSDPLVTRHSVGNGEVLLTTPSYMQSSARDQILAVCTQLLDSLIARYSVAHLNGPPAEYIVSQAPGKIIVTIINNSGSTWNGNIVVHHPGGSRGVSKYTVQEYINDQAVSFDDAPAGLSIRGQVPAYGVRVFAAEFTPAPTASRVQPHHL